MLRVLVIIFLISMTKTLYATDKIDANTIITKPTIYRHTILDLSKGNFIIRNNASLTIDDCKIIGTLSPANQTLFFVEKGSLNLNNNEVVINTSMLDPHPETQSLAYVVRLEEAGLRLVNNSFNITQAFTAGLLITNIRKKTNHIYIAKNTVNDFHGVFYLLNSTHALIENNILKKNSYGNIVIIGSYSEINNNSILFSGRDLIGDGDGIDVIDSNNIKLLNNVISTPGCFGIWIISSESVYIDNNTITGGVTYAISVKNPVLEDKNNDVINLFAKFGQKNMKNKPSSYIVITNNILHQNRYGIAGTDVSHLTIIGNSFSQRFKNATTRKFWTDNNTLMKNVTDFVWENNWYKEAFTQENNGDNRHTQFVIFPAEGGVLI